MRTVDLWSYLPPFLKEFLEFSEIMKAEQPEFQDLTKNLEDMMKDCFIYTATAKGISRYESIEKIRPDASASLESRRSTVLAHWWNKIPYTLRTLKSRIAMIQGNDNIQISFPEDNPYCIQIITRLETQGQVDDLAYILTTMIPANLVIDSANRLEATIESTLFCGMGAAVTGTLILTNDLNETVQTDIPHFVGVGMVETNCLFLTDDLNEIINT